MNEVFHEVRRGGILVAAPESAIAPDGSADTGQFRPSVDEMTHALETAGFNVRPMRRVEDLVGLVASALDGSNRLVLPEVFVVDDSFLHTVGINLKAALEAIGCSDSLLVIMSGAWPEGLPEETYGDISSLHRPFPLPVFVEEVASLATPLSMRGAAVPASHP